MPRFASGELRGGLALTEPGCGTDLQAIQTRAAWEGDGYVINGTKTWITNGIEGTCFALLVKTDPVVEPRHRGMSMFLAEKSRASRSAASSRSSALQGRRFRGAGLRGLPDPVGPIDRRRRGPGVLAHDGRARAGPHQRGGAT